MCSGAREKLTVCILKHTNFLTLNKLVSNLARSSSCLFFDISVALPLFRQLENRTITKYSRWKTVTFVTRFLGVCLLDVALAWLML